MISKLAHLTIQHTTSTIMAKKLKRRAKEVEKETAKKHKVIINKKLIVYLSNEEIIENTKQAKKEKTTLINHLKSKYVHKVMRQDEANDIDQVINKYLERFDLTRNEVILTRRRNDSKKYELINQLIRDLYYENRDTIKRLDIRKKFKFPESRLIVAFSKK